MFILVTKVDCILLMKMQNECRILRGSPASRINCRLQTFAASWIHFSARRRTSAYCFSRARLAQFKLSWFHLEGPMAPYSPDLYPLDYHVSSAMLEKYHNLRPKPKTIREGRIGADMGRFTPGTHKLLVPSIRFAIRHSWRRWLLLTYPITSRPIIGWLHIQRGHVTKILDVISIIAMITESIIQGSVVGPPSYVVAASGLHPILAENSMMK